MTWNLGSKPGVVDAVDKFGRPMEVALPSGRCAICPGNCYRAACPLQPEPVTDDFAATHPMRRAWCVIDKGPCPGDCYGNECVLRDATANATTERTDLAPQREQRDPSGSQLFIAGIGGMVVGYAMVLAWAWFAS